MDGEKTAKVTCLSRKGEFARLDITGAKAHAVLSKVVRPFRYADFRRARLFRTKLDLIRTSARVLLRFFLGQSSLLACSGVKPAECRIHAGTIKSAIVTWKAYGQQSVLVRMFSHLLHTYDLDTLTLAHSQQDFKCRQGGESSSWSPSTPESAYTSSADIWQGLTSLETSVNFPSGGILSLIVEDPRPQHEATSTSRHPGSAPSTSLWTGPDVNALRPLAGLESPSNNPPVNIYSLTGDASFASRPISFSEPPIREGRLVQDPPFRSAKPLELWHEALRTGSATAVADCPLLWQPERTADGKPLWPQPPSETLLSEQRRQARLASFGLPVEPTRATLWRGQSRGRGCGASKGDAETEGTGRVHAGCPVWLIQRPASSAAFAG